MVLIKSRTLSSPSATIFSGVSAAANSAGVALLTPASVACAERTTATRSVNGLTCCSSPRGCGCASWNRRNASTISASVQRFGVATFFAAFLTLLLAAFLRAALRGFDLAAVAGGLRVGFVRGVVFLAMIHLY